MPSAPRWRYTERLRSPSWSAFEVHVAATSSVEPVRPTRDHPTPARAPGHGADSACSFPVNDRLLWSRPYPRRRAKNTNSRPGRSGAPRTSSTLYPFATNDASTSSGSRKRSVESDVNTSPSEANTHVQRNVTSGPLTSVTSIQVSTAPPPSICATLCDVSRLHSCPPLCAGSRASHSPRPAARPAHYAPRRRIPPAGRAHSPAPHRAACSWQGCSCRAIG